MIEARGDTLHWFYEASLIRVGTGGELAPDRRPEERHSSVRRRGPIRRPYRHLPERFGHWNTPWRRFDRWARAGIWQRVFDALRDLDLVWLILDSAVIRPYPCMAGAKSDGTGVARLSRPSTGAGAGSEPRDHQLGAGTNWPPTSRAVGPTASASPGAAGPRLTNPILAANLLLFVELGTAGCPVTACRDRAGRGGRFVRADPPDDTETGLRVTARVVTDWGEGNCGRIPCDRADPTRVVPPPMELHDPPADGG